MLVYLPRFARVPLYAVLAQIVPVVANAAPEFGQQHRPYPVTEEREPCARYDPLRLPHFGDTHVHTALSFDASSQDTRNTPDDAYRFARGGRMGIQPYNASDQPQRSVQLDRPLQFTAVTDHSEFLGEISICSTPGSLKYWHPVCMAHRYLPGLSFATFGAYGLTGKNRWGFCGDDNKDCFARADHVWQAIQHSAERAYDRSSDCSFTSFVGYEWTAVVGAGQNLHHNVLFRNKRVPDRALSWIETPSQVDLWDYLDRECVADKPGCDAVVIPHNTNLSGGLSFESARVSSAEIPSGPVTAEEAARRQHWNVLFEVMQHKGSSECDNRVGWIEDEFCNFEKLDYDSFGGKFKDSPIGMLSYFDDDADLSVTRLPQPNNYLRYALKKGLRQRAELGVNSFKFGLIASTDTHIGAAGLTAEKNHPGHGGAGVAAAEGVPKGLSDELEFSPGGLAVVWAEENTRDALFAAMRRRETYATSGTRPVLRFFGGWDYDPALCDSPELVAQAYAGGVPMGGDLPSVPAGELAPRFVVSALQDPGTPGNPGTALQRVQIIKGWYEDGELREQVLDVAGGANDAGVDIDTCQQHGQGHAQLCAVWRDPGFNPAAQAFYYARVLENPGCRWSQYACVDAGVSCADPASIPQGMEACCSDAHQPVLQERAWSSPIWYTPPS